jgi:DNA-binding LacI/PurR family transcriptional regulator
MKPAMGKTTIREIAEKAGVCIATVSRVLNQKDNVLPETRQKILALIERTGYRPNAMGRGLVLRRSRNIVLAHFSIADPYCVALSESVSSRCHELGYRMLLADCRCDAALEAEHLARVRDGSADGMIVSPLPIRDNIPVFRELAQSGFPVVVIDNAAPTVKMHCVKYDDVAAGAMAMDYLFAKGHRRIAFLQREHAFHTVEDRRRSFFESHRKRGVPVTPDCVVTMPYSFCDWDPSQLERLLALPGRPTAILTENEIVAVACMNILLRRSIRIPEDVAVMAIGDALLDSLVPVPMTTISLHPERAALHAVDLLAKLIETPPPRRPKPRTYVQKPSLVVRQSA